MRINVEPLSMCRVNATFLADPAADAFEQAAIASGQAYDIVRSSLTVSLTCRNANWAKDLAQDTERKWLAELRAQRELKQVTASSDEAKSKRGKRV